MTSTLPESRQRLSSVLWKLLVLRFPWRCSSPRLYLIEGDKMTGILIYMLYISVRVWTDAGRALHGAHYYSCGTGVRLLRRSVSMMTVSFLLQGHGYESYDVWRLFFAKSTRTHRYVPGTTGATRQTHTHVAATLHYTVIMLLDRQPCPESMGCHTTANVIPSQIFRPCVWSVITSGAQGGAGVNFV